MQTSGISSSKTRKVAGVAVFGLAIAMTGNWIACSPGVLDCQKVSCRDAAGAGGGDETGGAGGDGTGGTAAEPPPASCDDLMVKSLDDFESKFIVPRCGQSGCHGPKSVFPPKNLDMPAMIRTALVGQNSMIACKTDFYINKTDYKKSFVLAKIEATTDLLPCPSAPMGKADAGGTRMPNKDGKPGEQGTRLADGEIECFEWYVKQAAMAK